ncbi:unnamed protein product [Caenorhabditis brenneri]
MTSTRPKRNVRNPSIPVPIVEDDATVVRNTLERLVYTVDVISRFDRTRSDIAAIHRGESNKTMAQVITESRWHEQATKAKKECPLGSTAKKKKQYEEESDESEEDDPNVPSTSSKYQAPKPPPKTPTPSKAKLAAMKRKADAEKRKAQREEKKLEAERERKLEEEDEEEMPVLEKAIKLEETDANNTVIPAEVTDEPMEVDEPIKQEVIPQPSLEPMDCTEDVSGNNVPLPSLTPAVSHKTEEQGLIPDQSAPAPTSDGEAKNEITRKVEDKIQPPPNPDIFKQPESGPLLPEELPIVAPTASEIQHLKEPEPETEQISTEDTHYPVTEMPVSSDTPPMNVKPDISPRYDSTRVFHPDVCEPDEIVYTEGEIARQPWLADKYRQLWLYPLNHQRPFDDVEGRVWWPPVGKGQALLEEWNSIGPLTELQTLDFSLRPYHNTTLTLEKSDLAHKRYFELLSVYFAKKLQDNMLQGQSWINIQVASQQYARLQQEIFERREKMRFRMLCLPTRPFEELPKTSELIRYTKFDITWYTSSRMWRDRSNEQQLAVTQKDFLDNFESTSDSTILEFQKEMLEKARQVEEEAVAERIRNFRMPLVHDISKMSPFIRQQMVQFREKLARHVQYESFERMYMNDPACREIYELVAPLPAQDGLIILEAADELEALISSYKIRFGQENPAIQLPKAGNEKLPNERDIARITKRCVADIIDTVVLRDLSGCPTFPHRVPVHNNAIPVVRR